MWRILVNVARSEEVISNHFNAQSIGQRRGKEYERKLDILGNFRTKHCILLLLFLSCCGAVSSPPPKKIVVLA